MDFIWCTILRLGHIWILSILSLLFYQWWHLFSFNHYSYISIRIPSWQLTKRLKLLIQYLSLQIHSVFWWFYGFFGDLFGRQAFIGVISRRHYFTFSLLIMSMLANKKRLNSFQFIRKGLKNCKLDWVIL